MHTYGGWLELSRRALRHNLAGVAKLAGRAGIMAVVKANAYGAGAAGVARALKAEGVNRFAVASVDEAVALRDAGIDGDILCLTYFDLGDTDAIRRHHLTVTIHSPESASMLSGMASNHGERRRAWIKVDTGLGRLGVPVRDAAGFIERMYGDARLEIAGVYSTLTENRSRDRQQLEAFAALRAQLPALRGTVWSLASSHGILSLAESVFDVVRPGIVLLGFAPSEPCRLDAQRFAELDPIPVVTWKARITAVKNVPAGNQIGYGEQAPLARDRRVASLEVGWSNGYHATQASGGCVLIGGRRAPVLELSANTTLVDVTAIESARAGGEAVLLGRQDDEEISAEALARSGHGVYRMLAGIPADVPRIWSQ